MAGSRWFLRLAAVLVGLANLVVMAWFFGGDPVGPAGAVWGDIILGRAVPYVLAAVAAGLVASEVAVRRFDDLSALGSFVFFDKLSYARAGVVGAVCLGGVTMGLLLGAVLGLEVFVHDAGQLAPFEGAVAAALSSGGAGFFGGIFGAVAGAVEGLVLAPPLAAILGRSGGGPWARRAA